MTSFHRRKVVAASISLLALSWLASPPATAAPATIRNIPPTLHFAPAGTPPADIGAAIKAAGADLDWETTNESPGAVRLRIRIRAHEAAVVVGYDKSNYWIDYADSFNLDYNPNDLRRPGRNGRVIKGPRIHHNYNKWVAKLSSAIASWAKTPPKAAVIAPVSSGDLLLIADELEKLDVLRQRGVLTQDEFDQQKRKLLSR